jgi:lysine 6-dehydrogenase
VVLIRLEFVGRLKVQESGAVPTSEEENSRLRYDIIDRFDPRSGLSAMQRTTAFPASIVAQMMARGLTTRKGAVPQERCIPPEAFVKELAARDIRIEESFVE